MKVSILFILRYIPFWAVPLLIISGEFGYLYWLKNRTSIAIIFGLIAIICLFSICFYFFMGSPDRSASSVINFLI